MLSRAEIILTELLVSRGVASREAIDRCARIKNASPTPVSLVDALVDSGDLDRTQAASIADEARALDEALQPNLPGSGKLGEFRLIREIGRGGMGIVYEAVQESLGRRVAIKILPAGAALDERLAARFLRESRAASRLDHPGIVRIFTSGVEEGVFYFAMELIEGHSLADEVAAGPVASERAARIVAQVARAVEHAHEAGLAHRDIKPENILVGPDDQPRLTDFGLVHEFLASSRTLSFHVLGTPAYIPLEQALGQPVDSRSDVYSLGAVLYSLLSGRPPYEGGTPSVVLARVLSDGPAPLLTVRPEIPAGLAAICGKAMARHPDGRYPRAAELAEDLERFIRGDEVRVSSPKRRLALSLAALSVLTIAIASVLTLGTRSPEPRAIELKASATIGPSFTLVNRTPVQKRCISLSPDGAELSYTTDPEATRETYMQSLAEGSIAPLAALSVDELRPACLSYSPDGRFLAGAATCAEHKTCFSILNRQDHTLRTYPIPIGLSSWSADGHEVVLTRSTSEDRSQLPGSSVRFATLYVASGRSQTIRAAELAVPSYSPHGRRIAFSSLTGGQFDLWTIAPDGGDMVRVTDDIELDSHPVWSGDGTLLYFGSERGGKWGLWSIAVNEETGRPMGLPQPISDAVFAVPFLLALSADGKTMAIAPKQDPGRLIRLDLDADADGLRSPPTVLPLVPTPAFSPSASPDGRRLAVTFRAQQEDIAILPMDGAAEPRYLTDDAHHDADPRWSPDGSRIAFRSDRSGKPEIWTIRPDGSDLLQVTHTQGRGARSPVWSPDGTRIAYHVEGEGGFMIRLTQGSGSGSPEPLAPPIAAGHEFVPSSWSPDGATLAGSMDGIVLYSIASRSYRRVGSAGESPIWLPDGRRLLFKSERKIHLVSVKTGESRSIFSAEPNDLDSAIAVSADGRTVYATLTSSGEEIWLAKLAD